ncbi:MAG: MbnP family protein [Bacteroidia bacterium]
MLKRILPLMFVCCLATTGWAQTTVMLNFQHQFGNDELTMDAPYTVSAGYDLKIQRLEYYLSELAIVHDGGQITMIPNMWLLVSPETDSAYNLGVFNIQSIEAINFSIGVDPAVNNADPASYAAGHPLAPRNPSMHWGWNAGYRFAALEGYAGTGLVFNYQIHALGNENYNSSSVSFDPIATGDSTQLYIKADYEMMFENIDVSGGMIVHGPVGESVTLLSDMATTVFSAGETPWATAVEADFIGTLILAPNPTTDRSYLEYDLPAGHTYNMQLTDLSGRTIQAESIANLQGRLVLDNLQSGLYFVNVFQDGKRVSMDKLSVIR